MCDEHVLLDGDLWDELAGALDTGEVERARHLLQELRPASWDEVGPE